MKDRHDKNVYVCVCVKIRRIEVLFACLVISKLSHERIELYNKLLLLATNVVVCIMYIYVRMLSLSQEPSKQLLLLCPNQGRVSVYIFACYFSEEI
jgi:hypothetical protein